MNAFEIPKKLSALLISAIGIFLLANPAFGQVSQTPRLYVAPLHPQYGETNIRVVSETVTVELVRTIPEILRLEFGAWDFPREVTILVDGDYNAATFVSELVARRIEGLRLRFGPYDIGSNERPGIVGLPESRLDSTGFRLGTDSVVLVVVEAGSTTPETERRGVMALVGRIEQERIALREKGVHAQVHVDITGERSFSNAIFVELTKSISPESLLVTYQAGSRRVTSDYLSIIEACGGLF